MMKSLAISLTTALTAVLLSGTALAQVSEAEVSAMIEESYPVQVLKVEAGEVDGESAWMVTVMNTGGNFNEAFAVNTLAVDRQTGELIPAFQSGPNGSGGGEIIGGADKDGVNPTRARDGVWR